MVLVMPEYTDLEYEVYDIQKWRFNKAASEA